MSPFRYRDRDESLGSAAAGLALGALAGFAVGVVLAQKVGGVAGIAARIRDRLHRRGGAEDEGEEERLDEDELEEHDEYAVLEERVLEAFRNDPVLSERAVDIGAVSDGVIELTGWVNEESEAEHAVTLARGVPGVATVVNRLAVGEEEELLDDNARRFADGDSALTEARWEGNRVGTGRRRQGTSDEPDRHADPRTDLEERYTDEQHAVREAADDIEGIAERRRRRKSAKGDRTGGSPVAPTGVPKADHVADPESAPDSDRLG